MNKKMPPDPITDLAAMATQLHELFEALMAAGFTESQAMQMMCVLITSGNASDS